MQDKVASGVAHADAALQVFRAAHTPDRSADPEDAEAISDLIVDLLHLAEKRGVLPSAMDWFVNRALNHYEAESDPDNANKDV